MEPTDSRKNQLVDQVPKRLKEIRFGLGSSQDIVKQGVLEVCDRTLFDLSRDHIPTKNGPLDPRMGVSEKNSICETCGQTLQTCNGHFGYIKLALPVLHVGYLKAIITILQNICKECACILLTEEERRDSLRTLRRKDLDDVQKSKIWKKINVQCRKVKSCHACGTVNGRVKKAGLGPLKIIHEKFHTYDSSKAINKKAPREKIDFEKSFDYVRTHGGDEITRSMKRAVDDISPLKILNLFKRIKNSDCELLGMNRAEGRPEMMIWQYFPVSPVCVRPSVLQDTGTTEDDITSKVSDIVHINTLIKEGLQNGSPLSTIMEQWDFMQLQIAMIVHSETPGVQAASLQHAPIRGLCQRLKGKQGRFRANLSGKRVDFSGRTVISPDPNLAINEVAVPQLVAKNLTFPERVSRYNIEKLRKRVMNGPEKWPGANYIVKGVTDIKQYLKFGKPAMHANKLEIGDVVERHLENGDVVLFNRQPSLHRLSMMSHRVRVRPNRTFRINECVCTPYNADFDGDEMNIHVPQTEEARVEAAELMDVKNNLATPRNGEPIVAAIQDFITGAYLMSNKDNFFDRKTFSNICMFMVQGEMQVDLPPPAILKPRTLWTGKQIFNVLMRPNRESKVLVNLDAPCREFKNDPGQPRDMSQSDGWLCIRNSEVMCGVMDKATIGAGKKDSVFYVILRDFGSDAALQAMNRLARLCSRWLGEQGFSIGLSDVRPGERLVKIKKQLVESAYAECDLLIEEFNDEKSRKFAGKNEEQAMENSISGLLTKVRGQAGEHCFAELSKKNPPMIMAVCGSKGSSINVSQMVAVVGQQIIDSARPPDGFQDRTLPHFPRNARQPPSKGFVRNSFFSGLSPSEMFFHAMSGREGLVDTAVKTAETGYMSRRLMKSLEDLSTQYDLSVRNSAGTIIQFQYGDDKLDPVDMEAKGRPVNFERQFLHAEATTMVSGDRTLLPWEILDMTEKAMKRFKDNLTRRSLQGTELPYSDPVEEAVDDKESARGFAQSVEDFMSRKAQKIAGTRKRFGVPDGLSKSNSAGSRAKLKGAKEYIDYTAKISKTTLTAFIEACLRKYEKAEIEPGAAIGAIGAQSIGEPGTQMTLKTFHFAGVANMTVTQGVPRIKEIINASPSISTPIITCDLFKKDRVEAARVVKGRIEQTFLRDIIEYIQDCWSPRGCHITLKVDMDTIGLLQLDLEMSDIRQILLKNKKLHLSPLQVRTNKNYIRIDVTHVVEKPSRGTAAAASKVAKETQTAEDFLRLQSLKRALPDVPVCGYAGASRAVIKHSENGEHSLLVEGYGLRSCMTTMGVDPTTTRTNSVIEMRQVLGIEAARSTIIHEVDAVMGDMDIDPRHIQLLADVMTYRGEVLGITRFGLAKMRDSVLQLASFEKTPDHLFDAAWHGKKDRIEGVSECIIMGQSVGLGTGGMKVIRRLGIEAGEIGRKTCAFEDSWGEIMGIREKRKR